MVLNLSIRCPALCTVTGVTSDRDADHSPPFGVFYTVSVTGGEPCCKRKGMNGTSLKS